MRFARAIGTRLPPILARMFLDTLLPLAVAYVVVSYLADPAHIDTSELRANSLLMNTSQLFRKESNPFAAAVGSSAILILTSIAGAVAVGVPAGIVYGWSGNRVVKALAWSASTLAASLPAFFWAVAIELLMILLWVQWSIRFLPTAGFGLDEHLVLPSLALGIRPAAYIFRLTATAVEEIRHADYVRTAIAKGSRGTADPSAPCPAQRRTEHHRGDRARRERGAFEPRHRRVRVHLGRRGAHLRSGAGEPAFGARE